MCVPSSSMILAPDPWTDQNKKGKFQITVGIPQCITVQLDIERSIWTHWGLHQNLTKYCRRPWCLRNETEEGLVRPGEKSAGWRKISMTTKDKRKTLPSVNYMGEKTKPLLGKCKINYLYLSYYFGLDLSQLIICVEINRFNYLIIKSSQPSSSYLVHFIPQFRIYFTIQKGKFSKNSLLTEKILSERSVLRASLILRLQLSVFAALTKLTGQSQV